MDLEHELLRARERLHKVESSVLAVDLNVKNLRRVVDEIVPKVNHLARADEIAEAVAQRVDSQRQVTFTAVQKWTAVIGLLLLAIDVGTRLAGF